MMRVRIGAVAAALVAVGALAPSASAGVTPVVHPRAPQAAGCRGASCAGRNPHTTKCDRGARTLDRVRSDGGGPVVQLRVSAACSAAWAYVPKGFDGYRFKIQVQRGATYVESASFARVAYTPMVWSSDRYRACVEDYGSGGDWACTVWH